MPVTAEWTALGYLSFEGKGDGVARNPEVGIDWLQKAARQGDQTAQINLKNLGQSW